MATKKKTIKKAEDDKVIKRIFFTREQILQFIDMDEKEAGEFIIDIARFINDGSCPVMKDRYKARYFKSTFGDSIAKQLKLNEFRITQCQENAEKRKATSNDDTDIEGVDDGIVEGNDSVTDSKENVTEVTSENLSYEYFKKLYVKEDSGKFNTEALWNSKSDDDKRKIIAYVKAEIIGKIDVTRRQYPYQFINGNTWK